MNYLFEEIYDESLKLKENDSVETDRQGIEIQEFESLQAVPDEVFDKPEYSILLPPPNNALLTEIGKTPKKVLLKKNIILRNKDRHDEIKFDKSKEILQKAIYEGDTVLLCKKDSKPNYYSFIKCEDYFYVSVLDFNNDYNYTEVVDWRKVDENGFIKMLKQASRGTANSP